MKKRYKFTVFTPTYNRAYVLRRAFESLQKQTFRDFEWIVVDDGSTDNTRVLVEGLAQEASFSVRYFYQTHGHKKKAINYGVREAQGELFVFLDSDDELIPNALERFNFYWQCIPVEKRSQFCGIFGLCQYSDGDLVGTVFPQYLMTTNFNDVLFRYKVRGDKSVAFSLDVLQKFPFPENIPGLVPEGVIWCKMARRYPAFFVNEIFLVVHISEDSITPKRRFGGFVKNRAEGRALCASEMLNFEIKKYFFYSPQRFCIEAIMYVRSILHISLLRNVPRIKSWKGILLVFIFFPVGLIAVCVDNLFFFIEKRFGI